MISQLIIRAVDQENPGQTGPVLYKSSNHKPTPSSDSMTEASLEIMDGAYVLTAQSQSALSRDLLMEFLTGLSDQILHLDIINHETEKSGRSGSMRHELLDELMFEVGFLPALVDSNIDALLLSLPTASFGTTSHGIGPSMGSGMMSPKFPFIDASLDGKNQLWISIRETLQMDLVYSPADSSFNLVHGRIQGRVHAKSTLSRDSSSLDRPLWISVQLSRVPKRFVLGRLVDGSEFEAQRVLQWLRSSGESVPLHYSFDQNQVDGDRKRPCFDLRVKTEVQRKPTTMETSSDVIIMSLDLDCTLDQNLACENVKLGFDLSSFSEYVASRIVKGALGPEHVLFDPEIQRVEWTIPYCMGKRRHSLETRLKVPSSEFSDDVEVDLSILIGSGFAIEFTLPKISVSGMQITRCDVQSDTYLKKWLKYETHGVLSFHV